ncbi:MAG: hypothetical protein V2G42_09210 [bacterium JZ-2024 1]
MLNTRIVRKQIDAGVFIETTIPTMGNRLTEVALPFPQQKDKREKWGIKMKEPIKQKMELKKKSLEMLEL